jgi:two-component system, sensor histidine kinase
LIVGICRTQDIRLAAKKLRLNVDIDDQLPDNLLGDSRRLSQVLLNLLSNAIKFTDDGVVTLRVSVENLTPHDVKVRFLVGDTGIGISSEDQVCIFAPFTQVDASSTRRHSGTGLGLAIASDLVAAMGGVLGVESQLGSGSQFYFSITLLRKDTDRPKSEDSLRQKNNSTAERPLLSDLPQVQSLRVLLAEDVRANQQIVVRTLEKRGHTIDVASDGVQAVELATKSPYDVILMDVQMPNMDGFQATAAIRALDSKPEVPIIALTAHALVGDRQRCVTAGMDDYLAKPLDLVRLVQVVERYAPKPEFECGYVEGMRESH